jgi:hypothetical protein
VAFPAFALLAWSDTEVAATVAVALFVAVRSRPLLAMVLPFTLIRLGPDRLATVIQGLTSIVVYFGVAAAIVG